MRYHVSCGFGPYLPAEMGSDNVTCPTVLDPASLPRWALVLPRALRLRTLPPCRDGLWHRRMSCGPRSHLLAEEASDAATCPVASGLASPPRQAPVLPRVSWPSVGHRPRA
jgi:hypothetical protein